MFIFMLFGTLACIPTCYGLDGPGIESRWGARFSALAPTGPKANPVSSTTNTKSFLGVNRSGREVQQPPHLTSSLNKEQSCMYENPSSGSRAVPLRTVTQTYMTKLIVAFSKFTKAPTNTHRPK